MSLNTDIFDSVNNNNNTNWANFDTFPSATNENSETIAVNASSEIEDDWAEFQSNTDDQIESQTENINTLISTCFPYESLVNTDNSTMFELPNFTTFNDETKQIPCLKQSLSLWKNLSTISTDPIGIQYQWRRSNIERLFHQSLNVSSSIISDNSNQIQDNHTETSSIDINDLSILANTSRGKKPFPHSPIPIHSHPFPSIPIHSHPFSSIPVHSHPFSSIPVYSHPFRYF